MKTRGHAICRRDDPKACAARYDLHDSATEMCPDQQGTFVKRDGQRLPSKVVAAPVLAILRNRGQMHVTAVADALGWNAHRTSAACQRLVHDGSALRISHGIYAAVEVAKAVALVSLPQQLAPKIDGRRVGNSFSASEITVGDELFKALLQGKDVRVLLRSEGARGLMQKFQSMRLLTASQKSAAPRAAQVSPLEPADTHSAHADANSRTGS